MIGTLIGLPEGNYLAASKLQVNAPSDLQVDDITVECELELGGVVDQAAVKLGAGGIATIPLSAPAELAASGNAVLSCSATVSGATVSRAKVTAIRVDSLTQ